MARRFVEEFIPGMHTKRVQGLLLTGPVGVGKTHLAVASMRELIETRGIDAKFVVISDLLDRLRASFDDGARETKTAILAPITRADLVVIDELGASRPSDWVFETVEILIGGLYNALTPVLVTTNLANLGPGVSASSEAGYARSVARPETLGDRIGARMWSRLQEMCLPVEMISRDYRGSVRQ